MLNKLFTDLQTQIESINNTRDFERLINDIFSKIYGTEYVSTDYHTDNGCDGYISSSKTLVAKHCFEKPVPRKTNRKIEILKKARGDLKKAIVLSNNLEIKRWMFVTSYPIPTNVYVTIKNEAEVAGFELECFGPDLIAVKLLENKHILQNHPYLHVVRIDETLKHIDESLSVLVTDAQLSQTCQALGETPEPIFKTLMSVGQQKLSPNIFKAVPKSGNSLDFKRILEIYENTPSPELEKEVKSIIYSSFDQEAMLQGVHLLVSWYKFSRETIDTHLTFVDLGIDIARNIKKPDSEAILLAEKGSLLSTKFVLLDLEGWGRVETSNKIGILLITNEDKDVIVKELKNLNREFNELFKDAITKAYISNNHLAVTKVFSRIGDAAGNRAGHFLSLGIKDRAIFEQRLCKSSFMFAKMVSVQFNNETEIAYVLYNFANALGFIGETDEALKVLKEAVKLAKKNEMNDVLSNVERLEQLIKEPKIRLVNSGLN